MLTSGTFPSKYGVDVRVEGTIERTPDVKKLPKLFVKYVDEKDFNGCSYSITRATTL